MEEKIASVAMANIIADKIAQKSSVDSNLEQQEQKAEVKAVQESEKTDEEKREERREEQKEQDRREAASQIWRYKSMPTSILVETIQRESIAAPEHPKPTRTEAYKYAEEIVAKKIDQIT